MKGQKNKEDNDQKTAALLQGFDLIAGEIGKHNDEDSFAMDCPFCGAVCGFVLIKEVFSAAGRCSVCGIPVHIRRKI